MALRHGGFVRWGIERSETSLCIPSVDRFRFDPRFHAQRESVWRPYGGSMTTATARAGFLLSPLIENRQSFFSLASTNWQHELADLEVASVRITADGRKGGASCYQSPVRLRFYRLDFSGRIWVKDAKEAAFATVRSGEGTHAYLRARR